MIWVSSPSVTMCLRRPSAYGSTLRLFRMCRASSNAAGSSLPSCSPGTGLDHDPEAAQHSGGLAALELRQDLLERDALAALLLLAGGAAPLDELGIVQEGDLQREDARL